MDLSGSFSADPEVVASEVDGGAALLDLRSSQYFGLNAVGAFIWAQIQEPKTLDSVVVSVADTYDVDLDVCRADVARLLGEFLSAGVIRHHG